MAVKVLHQKKTSKFFHTAQPTANAGSDLDSMNVTKGGIDNDKESN